MFCFDLWSRDQIDAVRPLRRSLAYVSSINCVALYHKDTRTALLTCHCGKSQLPDVKAVMRWKDETKQSNTCGMQAQSNYTNDDASGGQNDLMTMVVRFRNSSWSPSVSSQKSATYQFAQSDVVACRVLTDVEVEVGASVPTPFLVSSLRLAEQALQSANVNDTVVLRLGLTARSKCARVEDQV